MTGQKTVPHARACEWRKNTFQVNVSGERDPVARPSASVRQDVVSMRRAARRVWVRKMVRAAYDPVVSRADMIMAEVGVNKHKCCAAA